jgi:DNA-binding MarR family transcriptional regulator
VARRRQLPFDPIAEARRQWVAHGWAEESVGMAFVTSIMRVHQILLGQAEGILRPLGLTFARYEVLMLLVFSREGELPPGTIGRRLQVGAASVTNALDRLEAAGLVRRRTNPSDGRGVLAQLTPAGRRLAEQATDALNGWFATGIPLGPDQMDEAFCVLEAFRHGAGDFEADPR